MPDPPRFAEVAPGVHLLRHPGLAATERGGPTRGGVPVNAVLVVGEGAALLVDTLSTDAQARELAEAARAVTAYPWRVVNTHHHFDHCFGNAVLAAGGPVWGQEEAARLLAREAAALQRRWYAEWAPTEPALADGLAAVRVVAPDRTVHTRTALSVGGRAVELAHLGRGHTAGDLVVRVPDADVLIAGDLVEQGGPPSFEDSYPLEWPATLAGLLALAGPATVVLPGHGAPVDREFVTGLHAALTTLEWRIRDGHADAGPAGALAAAVAPELGWPEPVVRQAVRRGYAELAGRGD